MNVIHEVCGYVFLIMTDNSSVYQKMFQVYHKENPSMVIYSIRHPINNPIFDTLFTLYDMPHCYWVTEPSQISGFVEPITQKVHQAKWKVLVQIYHDECNSIIKETEHVALQYLGICMPVSQCEHACRTTVSGYLYACFTMRCM